MKPSKSILAGFWIFTALFALQMAFTAYAQLRVSQVAQEFAHLGFPSWFRIELSWAKFAGVAALLIPMVPARIKEWAYAGFAITLVSAILAHLAAAEGFAAWGWAAGTSVLWLLSYVFWRRLSTPEPGRSRGLQAPESFMQPNLGFSSGAQSSTAARI